MPGVRLDAVCDALADQRRRAVCRYVAATDRDAVALDELAGRIDPAVRDGGPSLRSKPEYDPRTRLHHVDLPKLADADVVEYEPNRRVATAGPALSIATDLVRAVDDDSGQKWP
jgi:hypothetical protein